MHQPDAHALLHLRHLLLDWYDVHARVLPWRISPAEGQTGKRPDPYHVWLSEIMLQQTSVVAVKPYFETFRTRYPSIADLAAAPLDEGLSLWAGLGYYARARNLHEGAKAISALGSFPDTQAGWSAIKWIGPYTSAAIAAIAFDQPNVPVDGNIERVLSRLWQIEAALPTGKPVFREAAARFEHPHRPGDFAQAMMDLGATICTPRNPMCGLCPWSKSCAAAALGNAKDYPKKQPKKIRPVRYGVAFVILDPAGVVVRRRPDSGLLGGMLEVPNLAWRDTPYTETDISFALYAPPRGWTKGAPVRHVFTHFELQMMVACTQTDQIQHLDGFQHLSLEALADAALPSLMQKIIASGRQALLAP